MQNFLKFERDNGLFARKYCGFHYWQGIRLEIGHSITGLRDMNAVVSVVVKKKWRRRITICKDFLKAILEFNRLKKCDILYFDQGLQGAYRNVDGEMVDVYFGYFGFEDNYRVQRCYYIKGSERSPQKPGIGTDLIMPYKLMEKLKYFFIPQNNIDENEDTFIRSLCEEINKKYNKKISADIVIQEVRYHCLLYRIYEKYYKKLLKKTAPRAIILQCHYDIILYPLYKVAKEFSIPVIELQHGQACNHMAYKYVDICKEGKELPDYLFTYGSFWEQYMRLPVGIKTIAIGNPFLEAMKEKYKDVILNEKAIIFYSSRFSYDGEELEKLAVDFCKKYVNKGYTIYFKFHPNEAAVWKEQYRKLGNCKEIQIVDPAMNVYQLFAYAKHHVFVASTVMFEAMNYDICRYFYNFEGALKDSILEKQLPLIEKNGGKAFCSSEELESLINRDIQEGIVPIDDIWKPNAKENGQKALKKILSMNCVKNR